MRFVQREIIEVAACLVAVAGLAKPVMPNYSSLGNAKQNPENSILPSTENHGVDYGKVVYDGMNAGSDAGAKVGGVIGTAAGIYQRWPMGSGGVGGRLVGGAFGAVGGLVGGGVAAAQIAYENRDCGNGDVVSRDATTYGEKMSKIDEAEQIKTAVENGVCFENNAAANAHPDVREAVRGFQNGGGFLPSSPEEALKNETCQKLDYGKSYLHDFNEKVAEICNQSPESRARCYAAAVLEYMGALPKGSFLNVDGEHNIKIVCANGEEYVFDKDGKIISEGINEGTFNISKPEDWVAHAQNDIIAAIEKLPKKSSLTQEECVQLLEEYISKERAREKNVKDLFQGRGNVALDTSKLEALLKERISFLRSILARGERATETEIEWHNSQNQTMLQELVSIAKKIDVLPMPDEEKQKFAEKELVSVNKLVTQISSLEEQAVARKLVSLTNNATYDKASCMCENPSIEIKSGILAGVFCKKCGKVVGLALNGKITRTNNRPK